ncbi:hypothetical protein HYN48_14285 [Flavobacterium magnum]|uniref:Uncharacterized protein n=1 Tax=Flavobacterium magnum TaxID=2162713 RepID=A0A2S0RGV3_9FLAO|nr:hypothetical protein [Flavobacterium magnum]AWA31167.1 hypothetical protein HYN48_14285 [Flavobacterium magnum]
MKKPDADYTQIPLPHPNTLTLTLKICGTIETPPERSRERFRQGIMDTVLELVRAGEFSIEYIGYQADRKGMHYLNKDIAEYHDCVYASVSVNHSIFSPVDVSTHTDEIIAAFIRIFEDKTHRHLDLDSATEKDGTRHRIIEMSSDWRFYSRHG